MKYFVSFSLCHTFLLFFFTFIGIMAGDGGIVHVFFVPCTLASGSPVLVRTVFTVLTAMYESPLQDVRNVHLLLFVVIPDGYYSFVS